MDTRWAQTSRDSKRDVRVILHPTAAIWDVRRGLSPASDDSVDLSDFVSDASHTAFEASVTLSFNREFFGESQPKPNQVLEIQLLQKGEWLPLWIGIVDAISQFTLQRGTRQMQLIAKTRDQQDIWRKTPRLTPLFPQLTELTYIAMRIARSAGMKGDEILIPKSAFTTPHTNTQLADMNAWDMITALFTPLGWAPFIDCLGRLRAANRELQSRRADIVLDDNRILKVGGQRQRPPSSRVRVMWLNPTLKKSKRQDQILTQETFTLGWFMPYWKKKLYFSEDKTQRATNTRLVPNPSMNVFLKFTQEKWIQQTENGGVLKFNNIANTAIMGSLLALWQASYWQPIPVAGGIGGGATIPAGRKVEAGFQLAFMTLMLNIGTGTYEIWGTPYDWVHARNTTEAFDSSVPTWVDNATDIESDFIANDEHAKAVAIRELIYLARSASKWNVTIVDDPRIEYGDILQFTDKSQLFVEDFTRRLERGSEAVLDVSGFLIIPIAKVSPGSGWVESPIIPEGPGGGGPIDPPIEPPGGGGEPTIPNYHDMVKAALGKFESPIVPLSEGDAGKAQLTRLAAWDIYQIDQNIRLFKKTGGAQINGRSTDILVQATDGSFADCATYTDGQNPTAVRTTWVDHVADSNTSDTSRYIVPTEAIANEPGPMVRRPL